jgi:endonuclease/exonuclease/phosphatase family metal-dependent hydrolase
MNPRADLFPTCCCLSIPLVFLTSALLCSAPVFLASAQQVKVMQWNVHGNIGTTTAQTGAGAAAIGRILNYLQPDLLLINEVADGPAATNTAALTQWVTANLPYLAGGNFYVTVSTEPSDVQRNAAISRYPILDPFTYPDVSTSLRGMLSFQLQLTGTNRLQVFHVHLKCCSDGSSCQTKQDEAQLFSDEMAAWAATNSNPYLFAGDLNEDESNPECTLSATYHPITTLVTNGGLAEFKPTTLDGEYRTWSTAPATPSIRFDYILAATNRLSPASGYVFSTADWAAHGLYTNAGPQNLPGDSATASDHYNAVAVYNFSTNGSLLQDIQTVFVIPMENQNWSSIKGNSSAPYINNTLLPMASHAEQYYNPPGLHPSLPNYLWLEAGTNFGITADLLPASAHQNTTNHLVKLLKNAGISWRSYNEDICGCNCPLANTNLYVPRHNPFVYFDDVTNTNNSNSASCIANVRPYAQLAGDLASNVVARYNWVVPNLCDDMHNTTGCATTDPVKNSDTWLANNLPAILSSQAYNNNGAIFILWDEGTGSSSDGPIGLIVLSPLAKGGGYSNTVHYTHSSTLRTFEEIFNVGPLLGDATNATDLSDLFGAAPAQLFVTPASGLASSGLPGGPFSPVSQTYTLTNPGTATASWTATNNANWLTLSATAGTLAPGSNTTVTVSINTSANSLASGNYSDTVSFANTTDGVGSTTRSASLTVNSASGGSFGFFDDFGTFAAGNLVGQNTWAQLGTAAALPLQVSSGQVVVPFGQSADNQDGYKNFTATNITVFCGAKLTVSNAPASSSPSYFLALTTSNNGAGFANYRLTAKDNGGGTALLGARITGQSGDPYTFGATGLSYGSQHIVIIEADGGGMVMKVFVDPPNSDLASQSAYVINNVGSGTPPTQVGSFVISQFASGTVPNVGLSIAKAVVADNFATAYNDLAGPVLTAFQTWQIQYFGSTNNPNAAPGADPDGDGMNNLAEFMAGTIPTNSASVFRITTIAPEGNNMRVTWTMGSGKTNVLQQAAAIAGAASNFTDTFTVITVGSITNYLDPGAVTSAPARYYRVRLGP